MRSRALLLGVLVGLFEAACDEARRLAGPAEGTSAAARCASCHGTAESAAPPPSTAGVHDTTDRAVGAHQAHGREGALAQAISCAECHVVPERVDEPGHLDDSRPKVVFGPLARSGGAAPTFDPIDLTCASVYCHGATVKGGDAKTPRWTRVDGSQSSCSSCHGAPPPPPHPASTDCAACHAGTVRPDGTIHVAGGLHLNGRVDTAAGGGTGAGACGACHAMPPPAPHVQSQDCGSCHPGFTATTASAALHQNGRVDLVAGGGACGSCHAIPPPAPHVQSQACGSCHSGFSATAANDALHRNGRVDVALGSASCGACHGIPPPAPHVQSQACGSCHSGFSATAANATLHRNGRVDVVAGGGACGACHTIPPPAPHVQSQACGSCHPGFTATAVNATVHRNGRIDLTEGACRTCHGQPPDSGRHRDHAEERVACGACHAGATAASGGPGHMNGIVDVSLAGWDAGRRECARACHGSESWGGR